MWEEYGSLIICKEQADLKFRTLNQDKGKGGERIGETLEKRGVRIKLRVGFD